MTLINIIELHSAIVNWIKNNCGLPDCFTAMSSKSSRSAYNPMTSYVKMSLSISWTSKPSSLQLSDVKVKSVFTMFKSYKNKQCYIDIRVKYYRSKRIKHTFPRLFSRYWWRSMWCASNTKMFKYTWHLLYLHECYVFLQVSLLYFESINPHVPPSSAHVLMASSLF